MGVASAFDVRLGRDRPAQVQRAGQQAEGVRARCSVRPGPAERERDADAGEQRHGVERVDDEHAAETDRIVGERQQQLRPVNGEGVQQRMGHEREPGEQRPATDRRHVAVQPGQQPAEQRRGERQVEQRVAFRAVEGEVLHRVAMDQQHVEVRQGAEHRAPDGRLRARATAEHGGADRGTQCSLGQRIHGAHLGRGR
jgi:hypothetical protein